MEDSLVPVGQGGA